MPILETSSMDKMVSYHVPKNTFFNKSRVDTSLWPYHLARFASIVSILLGVIALLGWTFALWLPPNFVALIGQITPNVAVSFFLTGIALWIRRDRPKARSYSFYLADVCSGIVFLLSFLSLFEYFFNINLG